MFGLSYTIKPIVWILGVGYCLFGTYEINRNQNGEYYFTYTFQESVDEGKSQGSFKNKLDAIGAADQHYILRMQKGLRVQSS